MKKFILFFLLLIFSGCHTSDEVRAELKMARDTELEEQAKEPPLPVSGILDVYVFGFESADAILITTENHVVMIDTGENQHGAEITAYLLNRGITHIDYLIITHFHKDHVGGAHEVIDFFAVNHIVVPNYRRESRSVARFEHAVNRAGLVPIVLTDTICFSFDDAHFTLFPSQLEYYDYGDDDNDDDDERESNAPRENDFSIVVSVAHGTNNFLFTGDAMEGRLAQILETDENVSYDFLKLPHHGRRNRRSVDFLNAINPRYVVSTDCEERPTDGRILNALQSLGAEVFFTRFGSVYITSDGVNLYQRSS